MWASSWHATQMSLSFQPCKSANIRQACTTAALNTCAELSPCLRMCVCVYVCVWCLTPCWDLEVKGVPAVVVPGPEVHSHLRDRGGRRIKWGGGGGNLILLGYWVKCHCCTLKKTLTSRPLSQPPKSQRSVTAQQLRRGEWLGVTEMVTLVEQNKNKMV